MEKSAWGQGSLGKVNIITLATPLPTPIIISLSKTPPDVARPRGDGALQVDGLVHGDGDPLRRGADTRRRELDADGEGAGLAEAVRVLRDAGVVAGVCARRRAQHQLRGEARVSHHPGAAR